MFQQSDADTFQTTFYVAPDMLVILINLPSDQKTALIEQSFHLSPSPLSPKKFKSLVTLFT